MKEVLEIDPLRLDKECLGQPELYYTYSVKLARARRELDSARSRAELAVSEASRLVRKKFAGEKITEAAIKERVVSRPEVRKAEDEVIEARHNMEVIQAMVYALDQRKRMLVLLVELHLSNYHADPRPKGAAREIVEASRKRGLRERLVRAAQEAEEPGSE